MISTRCCSPPAGPRPRPPGRPPARTGGNLADCAADRLVDPAPRWASGFRPQHHVLGDGQHRHQHEVLVHHADARRDGVVGVWILDLLAVGPGSRPRPAGTGRRGCSSAWTCRRRSRPAGRGSRLLQRQVDVVVGRTPGKALVIPRSSRTGGICAPGGRPSPVLQAQQTMGGARHRPGTDPCIL